VYQLYNLQILIEKVWPSSHTQIEEVTTLQIDFKRHKRDVQFLTIEFR